MRLAITVLSQLMLDVVFSAVQRKVLEVHLFITASTVTWQTGSLCLTDSENRATSYIYVLLLEISPLIQYKEEGGGQHGRSF